MESVDYKSERKFLSNWSSSASSGYRTYHPILAGLYWYFLSYPYILKEQEFVMDFFNNEELQLPRSEFKLMSLGCLLMHRL